MLLTVESPVAPHATSRLAERSGIRYIGTLALIPLILYLLPFFALRLGYMSDWTLSYWGVILEHSYHMQSQNADVILFGDSTATYDIDTPGISRDLGLKVINVPNTVTSLAVLHDETLRNYLAQNRPPRLIVFFLSAWDTDFSHLPVESAFEGLEMMMRHDSLGQIVAYARKKPINVALLPFQFYANRSRLSQTLRLEHHDSVTVKAGHVDLVGDAFTGSCSIDQVRQLSHSDRSVAELSAAYTSPDTRTLVYLAPIPQCDGASKIHDFTHPQVSVVPPLVLPATYFAKDGWQAHMLATHINIPTKDLEIHIREKLSGK